MTARDYLADIEQKRVQIGLLKAELDACYASINLLPGVSYDGVNVQTTTKDSKVLRMIDEATDKYKKLRDLIETYDHERTERMELINRLGVPEYITVLTGRYVQGLRFWEIARTMGRSERRTYELHRRALAELEGMMEEVERGGSEVQGV